MCSSMHRMLRFFPSLELYMSISVFYTTCNIYIYIYIYIYIKEMISIFIVLSQVYTLDDVRWGLETVAKPIF